MQNNVGNEVDVISYIHVLIKHKKTILLFCLLSVFASILWVVTFPPLYETSMLLGTERSAFSADIVVERIKGNFYLSDVLKALNVSTLFPLKIHAYTPGSDVVLISIKGTREQVNRSREVLRQLLIEINSANQKANKKMKEEKWLTREAKQQALRAENQKINAQLFIQSRVLQRELNEKESIVKNLEENFSALQTQEKAIQERSEGLETMIASNLPQSKRELERAKNKVSERITVAKNEVEKTRLALAENLANKVDNNITLKDDYVDYSPIVVLKEPTSQALSSKSPQVVAVSVVVGLIAGILFAFLAEFWKEQSKKYVLLEE